MGSPNGTQPEGLSIESLSIWASASTDLTAFLFGNSLVLIVAVLLLLSCIKHSLMCWELRQDKRRLHSCHIRHCALLLAAKKLQHDEADGGEKESTAEDKLNTAAVCESEPAAPVTTSQASRSVTQKDAPNTTQTNFVPNTTVPVAADGVASAPTCAPRNDGAGPVQEKTESELAHFRVPSLQLPLTSTSSSDLSFSSSPKSVTSRLLSRLSLSPGAMDVVPSAAESSTKPPSNAGGDFSPRRHGCFPRYTEDEQRRIDEKRQANAQAWMEAKRALESTENLNLSLASPPLSTSRRSIASENAATSGESLS